MPEDKGPVSKSSTHTSRSLSQTGEQKDKYWHQESIHIYEVKITEVEDNHQNSTNSINHRILRSQKGQVTKPQEPYGGRDRSSPKYTALKITEIQPNTNLQRTFLKRFQNP